MAGQQQPHVSGLQGGSGGWKVVVVIGHHRLDTPNRKRRPPTVLTASSANSEPCYPKAVRTLPSQKKSRLWASKGRLRISVCSIHGVWTMRPYRHIDQKTSSPFGGCIRCGVSGHKRPLPPCDPRAVMKLPLFRVRSGTWVITVRW